MLFTIHCNFAPGAFAHAEALRLEHYAFLRTAKYSIVEGGPLLASDGTPAGMLMVVDLADAEAAKAFIAQEPYNAHGFFETVQVRRWSHVIPEPQADYIEQEYRRELAKRET